MVAAVKHYKAGFVVSNSNIRPGDTLADIIALKEKNGHSTVAITEDGTATGRLLGVPENIYGFTLPLGNTCGMNGFAAYIGLMSIFAYRLYGHPVTVGAVFEFVFLGIVLSIGAAGVKGSGIIMSTVLLETMGLPLGIVPIIAAIWPTLDPMHTVVNNVSDLTGTTLVAARANQTTPLEN